MSLFFFTWTADEEIVCKHMSVLLLLVEIISKVRSQTHPYTQTYPDWKGISEFAYTPNFEKHSRWSISYDQ